jgi:GH24 family phage-related lysozyme (muramidase)
VIEAVAYVASLLEAVIGPPQPSKAPLATPLAATSATPTGPSVEAVATGLAVQFEGCVLHPYQDSVGVWTVGYGSTRDANQRPVCSTTPNVTEPQARALLARDMGAAIGEVSRDVKVPLTPFQKGALSDLIYNIGAGNFRSSTLLRKINAGDYAGAATELDKWDRAGGQVLSGLLRRRQAETDTFNKV